MKTHLYHNSQMEQELHSKIDAAANERHGGAVPVDIQERIAAEKQHIFGSGHGTHLAVAAKLAEYEQRGWTARRGRRWHFTPEGFLLSNRLIGELLELQEVETLANTLEKIRGGQLPKRGE